MLHRFQPLQRTQGWGTLSVGGANEVPIPGRCLGMKERRTTIKENRRQRRSVLGELTKGQQLVRKLVPPTVSLADELIAERRGESRRESGPRS
jgi:hypothetical protein